LDTKGLLAAWREGLLAQHVLNGATTGYKSHPQLLRFKSCDDPIEAINAFLTAIYLESMARGYDFDGTKIDQLSALSRKIPVTAGQVDYELKLLKSKLLIRDNRRFEELSQLTVIPINGIFEVVDGPIETWEHVKANI
jgi:hypothetical protein